MYLEEEAVFFVWFGFVFKEIFFKEINVFESRGEEASGKRRTKIARKR